LLPGPQLRRVRTTIGAEKRDNPMMRFPSMSDFMRAMGGGPRRPHIAAPALLVVNPRPAVAVPGASGLPFGHPHPAALRLRDGRDASARHATTLAAEAARAHVPLVSRWAVTAP